jgi:hypothetical protein
VYLAFLFGSLALVDPATPLDDRILSPIYLLAIIVGMYGVHRALTLDRVMTLPRVGKAATVLMLSGFCVSTLIRGFDVFQYSRHEGFGYVNWRWRDSQLMKFVEALPDTTLVYTNVPDAVYFHTGNPSRLLPIPEKQLTPKQFKQRRAELKQTQRRIRNEGAVFALFQGPSDTRFRRGNPSVSELQRLLHVEIYKRCDDGVFMIPELASEKVRRIALRARRVVFPPQTVGTSP